MARAGLPASLMVPTVFLQMLQVTYMWRIGITIAYRSGLRVLPPVIVFCTTTYLSFHWITDSIAGLLLGLILTRLMARVPWDTMPLPRLSRPAATDRHA